MVSVVIAALSGTASIGTAGLMDALNKADLAQALPAGRPVRRVFDVRLAGLDGGTVSCRDGVSLHPAIAAADVTAPDLVVVPGLDDDLARSFAENRGWVPWLARWHAAGAKIAGSCTGTFLVAEAGLLDGGSATTHWMFADELRRRYPAVSVTADQMIVDTGDVITSGGATAFLNLVLYLVERFAGHDHANMAAKVLLVDGHRPSQLPYIAFGRIFKQATGLSPASYRDAYGFRNGPAQLSAARGPVPGPGAETLAARLDKTTGQAAAPGPGHSCPHVAATEGLAGHQQWRLETDPPTIIAEFRRETGSMQCIASPASSLIPITYLTDS